MEIDLELLRCATMAMIFHCEQYDKNNSILPELKKHRNTITMMLEACDGKADSTSGKDLRVCEVIPRFFDPERNKPLPSKNDITFSDDVFIIDEDGMHGLAYYSFEDCQWKFHTDTLVDYNEVGHETKWKWYYPTFTVKDAF